MPLPRKKDTGFSGDPILNLLSARVMLTKVDEYTEPRVVTRKADGKVFTFDPSFECTVEIVDDGADGSHNGTKFSESFRYKQDKEGKWFNQANSKLGALTEVVKPGYFDEDSIPELDASDLEGFEMLCRVKPKKNPSTGAVTGSTIDWETMQPLPERVKASAALAAVEAEEDADFDDLPF